MSPEDRLDILLSARGSDARTPLAADEAALAPLVGAVERLREIGRQEPRREFALDLGAQLLARAGDLARGGAYVPGSASRQVSSSALPRPQAARRGLSARVGAGRTGTWWQSRLAQAVAAAAVLVVGTGGLLTAGAMAAPGSPLFGLHRWEQGVRVALDTSAADRARLHLQYLASALTAFDAQVAQHDGGAYRDALSTVQGEDGAADHDIASVAPGGERDALTAQLGSLRDRERVSLRAALGSPLEWSNRLLTTQALGGLGEQIPTITSITVEHGDGQDAHMWRVVLVGEGFLPGATCVVGGRPVGTVESVTATQLVVQWTGDERGLGAGALGVLNPDGTAAAKAIQRAMDGDGASLTPGAPGTPGQGDGRGGDHGSQGDGRGATPTTTAWPEPTDSSEGSPTPSPGGRH